MDAEPFLAVPVTDAGDPRLALYAAVRDPALARVHQLFVAEGRLVVQRLIDDRRHTIRSLLVTETACRALAASLARLPSDVPVFVGASGLVQAITGYPLHRGCLALVERPPAVDLEGILAAARLLVVLEEVSDADNVGAVFRNAAAFGADAVLLSPGTCDPLYRKAIRTSMAATLRLPFARLAPWPGRLAALRQGGFTLVALTPEAGAETVAAFCAGPRPPRLALLVGAEGPGLSPAALAAAARRVRIPIDERIDSLNLAAATAVMLARLSE